MDARLQLRVQRSGWDRAAPHYDQGWQSALHPATSLVLERAALQPGERVLDVACGSGVLSEAAALRVTEAGAVIGTDISDTMLAIAAQRVPAGRFVRADAQDLEALRPMAPFDAALCGLGLMYVPNPQIALSEMTRLLRSGGRIATSVWGERRACAWASIFEIVDARVRSEVCPMFFRLGSGDALAAALRSAGLEKVQSLRIPSMLSFADAQAACDAAFLGGPVALAYARFDAETRAAVRAEYLASIDAYREGAAYRLPGEFIVAWGVAT